MRKPPTAAATNRAIEIGRALKPVLQEGEFAAIMGLDGNSLVLVPGEMKARLDAGGESTTRDTSSALLALVTLLTKVFWEHWKTIHGEHAEEKAEEMLPALLGPDGQPVRA